jgi:hypothetical protein
MKFWGLNNMAFLLTLLLTPFHGYFFYSLWLLWKKGTDKLNWYQGLHFAISANVVVHFWIQFFNFI